MTPARRFGLDVGLAFAGFALVGAVVVLLVEGVEQARWFEQLDVSSWLRFVLARWPGRVASALPVLGALAAGAVSARWESLGAFASLEAAGLRPARLAVAAVAAALLVGVVGAGLQQVAATAAVREVAAQGTWVAVERPDGKLFVRADLLTDDLALGVSGAEVVDGVLGTTFRASRADRVGGAWTLSGVRGAGDFAVLLPAPDVWRARAFGAGPDAPWTTCWASRDLASGRAWLAEALVRLVACGVLVGLAVPLGRRPWGAFGVVALAVGWRVLQTGATSAAASGSWPLWIAMMGPLALVAIVAMGFGGVTSGGPHERAANRGKVMPP